jgi:hypothetical protein
MNNAIFSIKVSNISIEGENVSMHSTIKAIQEFKFMKWSFQSIAAKSRQ